MNPLTPHPSTSVETITERRGPAGEERGPIWGWFQPHGVPRSASLSLTLSSCLQRWPSNLLKFLERELRECWGSVWINFCRGLSTWFRLCCSDLDCFSCGERNKRLPKWNDCKAASNVRERRLCELKGHYVVFGEEIKALNSKFDSINEALAIFFCSMSE